MTLINLLVKDDTAKLVEQLSEDNRMLLTRLIELWVSKPKPLIQVMEELGEYASKQGLTKEKLDELLETE